jgi:hypothetical protein
MTRPDQVKFERFAMVFDPLDQRMLAFAFANQMNLERNLNHQPCRVLRKAGNPLYLIDLSYDDYWVEVEFRPELTFSAILIAYYEPPNDSAIVWKMSAPLAAHISFVAMQERLNGILQSALQIITSWKPEFIMNNGQPLENLTKKYYGKDFQR